ARRRRLRAGRHLNGPGGIALPQQYAENALQGSGDDQRETGIGDVAESFRISRQGCRSHVVSEPREEIIAKHTSRMRWQQRLKQTGQSALPLPGRSAPAASRSAAAGRAKAASD